MVVSGIVLESPGVVAGKCKSLCKEFLQGSVGLSVLEQNSNLAWNKPNKGVLKVNCDAAFSESSKIASIAAICRDHRGWICGRYAKSGVKCASALEAEFLAFHLAIKLALDIKADKVLVETDSLGVTQILFGRQTHFYDINKIISSCWNVLAKLVFWRVSTIYREANILADFVASHVAESRQCWLRLDACPWWFKDKLSCFSRVCLRFSIHQKKMRRRRGRREESTVRLGPLWKTLSVIMFATLMSLSLTLHCRLNK